MTEQEKQAQKLILSSIEQSLHIIASQYTKYCEDHLTKAIPLVFALEAHRVFLESYKKGIQEQEKADNAHDDLGK